MEIFGHRVKAALVLIRLVAPFSKRRLLKLFQHNLGIDRDDVFLIVRKDRLVVRLLPLYEP